MSGPSGPTGPERRVDEHVDALLHGRRPERGAAGSEELEAIRGANQVLLAAPGRDTPDPAFVDRLRGQIARELGEPARSRWRVTLSRRSLLGTAGAGAAAVVAAIVGYRLRDLVPPGQPVLVPPGATWLAAAPLAEVPPGHVVTYSTSAMRILVANDAGTVRALSGTCTHLGCALQPGSSRIDCPCHAASFRLDGEVLHHNLPVPPPPLPIVRSRVVDGEIEVYAV